jgi:hypothetical protein
MTLEEEKKGGDNKMAHQTLRLLAVPSKVSTCQYIYLPGINNCQTEKKMNPDMKIDRVFRAVIASEKRMLRHEKGMRRLLDEGRFGSYPTDMKWRKANLLVRKMLWTLHEVSGFNHAAARKAEKAVRKLSS